MAAALLTGSLISAFQLYWLQKTFAASEEDFQSTAAMMLYQAINEYVVRTGNFSIQESTDAVYVTTDSFRLHNSNHNIQPEMISYGRHVVVNGKDYTTSPDFVRDMDTVKALFLKYMHQRNIDLPVTLSRIPGGQQVYAGEIVAPEENRLNSPQIKAHLKGVSFYLFRKNIIPISFSTLLILLTAGSLWYMLRTLRKQMRIDVMKNNFISNMTHELRTPIAVLRSTHEALDQFGYIHDTERALRYLKANRAVLDQLDTNIDRMLTIASFDSKNMHFPLAPVNMPQLLEQVRLCFSGNDDVQITLQYTLPQSIIQANAHVIETIATNLIDNAIKYSTPPAQITVSVSPSPKGWQLQVQDKGMGISAQHLPYIFDRFYRVPTGNVHNVKGYGLGLNYAKLLVENVGGRISVESRPGHGTLFTIEFPLHETH